jgi:hypothetical protein
MAYGNNLAMSLGFIGGIVPAVILIFFTLREYEGYFKDKHFFFLLAMGLFGGIGTALFYYWSIIYYSELSILTLLILLLLFSLYEMLLFTIVLSMKRFGRKYDLTYYGVVFGGTIAGVISMFSIYVFFTVYDPTLLAVLSIALLIPTLPLLYMSLGAMIGYGLYKNKSAKYSLRMVIYKTVFNFIFIFWLQGFLYLPPEHGFEWIGIGLVFAFFLYYYATNDLLPAALPERLQKHRRRRKRKEMQRG